MLEVRLLGGFEVRIDGVPQVLPSRPAQSLLAYLVLHPGAPHRRELLAGLLWPDHPEIVARRNLRAALWHARKALSAGKAGPEAYIRSDGIAMAFEVSSEYWLDTAALETGAEAAAGGRCTSADMIDLVSLYRGELLPGFYDDWAIPERERIEAVFASTMHLLLGRLLLEERWSDVLAWSRRWIAFGHAPEPAYRALMAAHAGLRDLSGAADAFRRCRSALSEEFGIEPSPQMTTLYEALVRGESPSRLGAQSLGAIVAAVQGPVVPPVSAAPAPGAPPFRGLQHFEEENAGLFFGRDALVERLITRLQRDPSLLIVVGASGSGKSSLLRAGLVPALKAGRLAVAGRLPSRHVHLITPTAQPLEALVRTFARDASPAPVAVDLPAALAQNPRALCRVVQRLALGGGQRVLLVVDQLEELFTLCQTESARSAFIENLVSAADADIPLTVVMALRADFYAHCGAYPGLREALGEKQEYIGPMSAVELRQAIEGPAQQGEWTFSPGLVDLILRDVGNEPGALPLLSHALLETWKRREGRALTLAGYAASGGVHGAITRTAERAYQSLPRAAQAIARSTFLRLTALGEGTQDTRRRVNRAELIPASEVEPLVHEVLDTLANARLITLDGDAVEVAHEALIREWPRLKEWLNEDRDGLLLHRRLSETAQAWEEQGRDPEELYRGARLAQVAAWARSHVDRLSSLERDFLAASEALAGEEARQQRSAAAYELSTAALNVLPADPELSILLAMRAVSVTYASDGTYVPEAATALHRAIMTSRVRLALEEGVHAGSVNSVAFCPVEGDNRLVTAGADGRAIVWNGATGHALLTLSGHETGINRAVFSPDGRRIATGSDDHTARLWDAASGAPLLTLTGHTDGITWVAFSPDGSRLLSTSRDGSAVLWLLPPMPAAGDARRLLVLRAGGGRPLWCADVSPDGSQLVTGGDDAAVRIWDAAIGQQLLTFDRHTAAVQAVAFSPDGGRVASTGLDTTARVWLTSTGEQIATFTDHTTFVRGIAFSPDGNHIVTSAVDGTARVWDSTTGKEIFVLAGHVKPVRSVAFSPDGRRLATASNDTGSEDHSVRIWSAGPNKELLNLTGHTDRIWDLAYSPDGRCLATSSYDGTARLWDASSGDLVLSLPAGRGAATVFAVSFSPEGTRLATACQDGSVRVWDVASGRELLLVAAHDRPAAVESMAFVGVQDVTFSPDGEWLATAGDDRAVRLWDARSGRDLATLRGHQDRVNGVAFSPDGARLITASNDGTARVWDAATGKVLSILTGHTGRVLGAAFASDSRRVASCSTDGTARLYEAATARLLHVLAGHHGGIRAVAFSPDGQQIGTGSHDSTVKLWEASTGRELMTLFGAAQAVHTLAFSPDGTRLAAAGADSIVRVYPLLIDELLALARTRVTRSFTEQECRRYLRAANCLREPGE